MLDAETNAPISNASVSVRPSPSYILAFSLNHPEPVEGKTDESGEASLGVSVSPQIGSMWYVEADGYLPEFQISGGRVPDAFGAAKNRGTWREQAVVRLYRGPIPRVTIVVPDGYRGPLFLERRRERRRENAAAAVALGRREFTCVAAPNGYVALPSDPILHAHLYETVQKADDWPRQVRIVQESGAPFTKEWDAMVNDTWPDSIWRLADWYCDDDLARYVYYVGDSSDLEKVRREIVEPFSARAVRKSEFERLRRDAGLPASSHDANGWRLGSRAGE